MDISLHKEHEDPRGSIFSVAIPDNRELMLFYCKKGYLRGGHSHNVDEIVVVLSGHLKYHKMLGEDEHITFYSDGDYIVNLAGQPHMAEFLENSWVMEWKLDTHNGEWSTTDYEPFRERVRHRMEEHHE